MDNLGDIRLFVEASTFGSLSAAGRRMGLSPAAASARLTKLETALATRLFERTTRQLRLTDEGNVYLQHCRQALSALDDGRAALQAGRATLPGKLRVSATSDFGRHALKGWLDDFEASHPGVTFGLVLSDNLSNLMQDDIDIAIRFGVLPDSAMMARRLAANRRVLCASPALLERHGVPTHPTELERFRCIVLGTAAGESVEWQFARGGEVASHHVNVASAMDTNDGDIARAWAVDGRGIALKSLWDIGADLQAGRLVVLMPEWCAPESPVHAVFPRGRYMPVRLRLLLDFLVERFALGSEELAQFIGSVDKAGS